MAGPTRQTRLPARARAPSATDLDAVPGEGTPRGLGAPHPGPGGPDGAGRPGRPPGSGRASLPPFPGGPEGPVGPVRRPPAPRPNGPGGPMRPGGGAPRPGGPGRRPPGRGPGGGRGGGGGGDGPGGPGDPFVPFDDDEGDEYGYVHDVPAERGGGPRGPGGPTRTAPRKPRKRSIVWRWRRPLFLIALAMLAGMTGVAVVFAQTELPELDVRATRLPSSARTTCCPRAATSRRPWPACSRTRTAPSSRWPTSHPCSSTR